MYHLEFKNERGYNLGNHNDIMAAVAEAYLISKQHYSLPVIIIYSGYDPINEKRYQVTLNIIRAPILDNDGMPFYPPLDKDGDPVIPTHYVTKYLN